MEQLVQYGIMNEESDLRIHVSPMTRRAYAFLTEDARKAVKNKGRWPTFVKGEVRATGFNVYPEEITSCKETIIPTKVLAAVRELYPNMDTSSRGKFAESVVEALFKEKKLNLPVAVHDIREATLKENKAGADFIFSGEKEYRVQVKFEWKCGPRDLGGNGVFYLQDQEWNPEKRH